jgi:hypothetical protein
VTLFKGEERIDQARSDNYGDFKFDRLEPESGAYRIEITAPGRAGKTVELELGESLNLGVIEV